jgi:hypothetical protein
MKVTVNEPLTASVLFTLGLHHHQYPLYCMKLTAESPSLKKIVIKKIKIKKQK